MAKLDYSKAEREMHEALQRMRVKNLAEGKTVTSRRAMEYFGLQEEEPRPTPEEPVARLLREEAHVEEEQAQKGSEDEEAPPPPATAPEQFDIEAPLPFSEDGELSSGEEEPEFEVIRRPPVYDVLRKARAQSGRPPKSIASPPPEVPPSDTFFEPASQLYILRQHIFWLKRKHVEERYEILGTTREEVMDFRRAKRLTDAQLARIKELNARAEEVKAAILAEEGVESEEKRIEREKQKHKTKRFNVKETWLQL